MATGDHVADGDRPRAIVVIVHDGVDLVSVELAGGRPGRPDLARPGRPDLALVDALARLQLAALRIGCSISIRDACPELWALLDLVGLTAFLPATPPPQPPAPTNQPLDPDGQLFG